MILKNQDNNIFKGALPITKPQFKEKYKKMK